jgi:hypothetical protein
MWSALFLYLTITGRCWPGYNRPPTHQESARKGVVANNLRKITFLQKLSYPASYKTIWLKK